MFLLQKIKILWAAALVDVFAVNIALNMDFEQLESDQSDDGFKSPDLNVEEGNNNSAENDEDGDNEDVERSSDVSES